MAEASHTVVPKVSVVSITYNHEAFIRDTLDGFLAQQTPFPVEYIIADDASTDCTAEIIRDYADRYPDILRPVLRTRNIGIHGNLISALSATRGEFIAICEGDDYWTDPQKLAKQVDYLDRHPETAVCFHPVRMIWEAGDGKESKRFPPVYTRGQLSVETLLLMNFIQFNSVMYRRLPSYDDIEDVMPMDWYLHLRHALHGDIAMLPDTMAVYRRHPQGVWWDSAKNPDRFWLTQGPKQAAMFDALLRLVDDHPRRRELAAAMAYFTVEKIANVRTPEGRATLDRILAENPRLASAALQHKNSPTRRLKAIWHALPAVLPSRKGLADVMPSRRAKASVPPAH